jgi:hypothetical protein
MGNAIELLREIHQDNPGRAFHTYTFDTQSGVGLMPVILDTAG